MASTKLCKKCGKKRLVKFFNKNKYRKDGLDHTCKKCRKEYYLQDKIKRVSKRQVTYYQFDKMRKEIENSNANVYVKKKKIDNLTEKYKNGELKFDF